MIQNSKVNNHNKYNNNASTMDGYVAIQRYMDRIVQGDGRCAAGMKALLLDTVTTQIVSSVYSQTEILRQQVYLVTRLDKISASKNINMNGSGGDAHNDALLSPSYSSSSSTNNDSSNLNSNDTSHLKAIVFIRPTSANIDALAHELQKPSFVEYHVFFSGMLDSGLLRVLAENDIKERIVQVQEFYADFVPINEDLFTLQCRNTISMSIAAGTSWAPKYAIQYERNLVGIQSILLALKKTPTVIRYSSYSACTEELAKDLYDAIAADDIFHFRPSGRKTSVLSSSQSTPSIQLSSNPSSLSSTIGAGGGGSGTPGKHSLLDGTGSTFMVLILDRRDDPVTPLLSQWTYQAMVHELLGLNNHRVLLKGAPNISKELEEVVLNAAEDSFFRTNRYSNFGELGESIQHLLQDYQKQTSSQNAGNLDTIEAMQAFMERFPELRSKSHTVSKHVAIMGELARLVEGCSLMDVSQFEQSLACNDDHNSHWRELMDKLSSPHIKIPDKLRLGLLYSLRYEVAGNIHMVQQAMSRGGVSQDMVNLIPAILRYAGVKSRGPGLYGEHHHLMTKMTKSFITTVQGIQNVYSQHIPAVMDTVQSILRGKLNGRQYPTLVPQVAVANTGTGSRKTSNPPSQDPSTIIPDEILIFMVGGITYEEGTKIAEFNQQHAKSIMAGGSGASASGRSSAIRVVLAGSTVHNSTSFLDELKATTSSILTSP